MAVRREKLDFRFAPRQYCSMENNKRFINELFRIVNGALRLDVDKVRNYTAFLAEKLESSGDTDSATRLRKMLEETDHQIRPADVRFSNTIPVDSESRFPLIEHIRLKTLQEPPIDLLQSQWDVVHEFLSVAKSYGTMDTPEMGGSLSFLMYGPPGTGKSRLARHIAKELGLDLYVARLDGLISSYLGSTSKNIRALFDFAAKTPCVLFLDEFDAIAKLRGDTQELGELKRVVNSFLQNLDSLGSHTIVLAATNHEGLLDAAVWRRFAYRLALKLPSREQRAHIWLSFIEPVTFSERSIGILADLSEGFSGSDIREICTRLRRRQSISGKPPTLKDAFQVLLNLAIGGEESGRFVAQLANKDTDAVVHALRLRDQRIYSMAIIAELIGVSKATIHRLSEKGVEHG